MLCWTMSSFVIVVNVPLPLLIYSIFRSPVLRPLVKKISSQPSPLTSIKLALLEELIVVVISEKIISSNDWAFIFIRNNKTRDKIIFFMTDIFKLLFVKF